METLNCPYFDNQHCLSCGLLSLESGQRKESKHRIFKQTFKDHLNTTVTTRSIFFPKTAFPSRNKAKFSVAGTLESPIIGLLDQDLKGKELLNCPLHKGSINALLPTLLKSINKYKVLPYDIETRSGELKGLILQCNQAETELLLRFILRSTEAIPRIQKLIPELSTAHSNLKVVSANIQPIPHQILEGEKEHLLTEQDVIWERYNEIDVAFAPQCFSQVTHQTAEALYGFFSDWVSNKQPQNLLDLYCGVGGFALHAASQSKAVVGVETSRAAIECAKKSSAKAKLENANFFCADVTEFLKQESGQTFDTIVCNPPRRGLSKETIDTIQGLQPKQIFYSSCNPATLARDIELLNRTHKLTQLAPFDMFPLTEHLEVVAILELG